MRSVSSEEMMDDSRMETGIPTPRPTAQNCCIKLSVLRYRVEVAISKNEGSSERPAIYTCMYIHDTHTHTHIHTHTLQANVSSKCSRFTSTAKIFRKCRDDSRMTSCLSVHKSHPHKYPYTWCFEID